MTAALLSPAALAHGGDGLALVLWFLICYGAGAVGGFVLFLIAYRKERGNKFRRLTVALTAWVVTFMICMVPVAMYEVPRLSRNQSAGPSGRVPPLQQLSERTRSLLQAQRKDIEREREHDASLRTQYVGSVKQSSDAVKARRLQLRDERAAMTGPEVDRFRALPLRLNLCNTAVTASPVPAVPAVPATGMDERAYFELGEMVDNCLDAALASSDPGRRRAVVDRFVPLIVAMANWRAMRPLASAAADRVVVDSAIDQRCQDAAVVARSPQCGDIARRRVDEYQDWISDFHAKAGVCHDLKAGSGDPPDFCRAWKQRRYEGFKSQLPGVSECDAVDAVATESCRAAAGYSKFVARPNFYGFCSTAAWIAEHEVAEVREVFAKVATQFSVACANYYDPRTFRQIDTQPIVNAFETLRREGATPAPQPVDLRSNYAALRRFCDRGTEVRYSSTIEFERCFADDGRFRIVQSFRGRDHVYRLAQWGDHTTSHEQWSVEPPLDPYRIVDHVPIVPALVRDDISDPRERMLWTIAALYGAQFSNGLPALQLPPTTRRGQLAVIPSTSMLLHIVADDGLVRRAQSIDRDGRQVADRVVNVSEVSLNGQVSNGRFKERASWRHLIRSGSPAQWMITAALAAFAVSGGAMLFVLWHRARRSRPVQLQTLALVRQWFLLTMLVFTLVSLFLTLPILLNAVRINWTILAVAGAALLGGALGVAAAAMTARRRTLQPSAGSDPPGSGGR